jgi:hypothetical protein
VIWSPGALRRYSATLCLSSWPSSAPSEQQEQHRLLVEKRSLDFGPPSCAAFSIAGSDLLPPCLGGGWRWGWSEEAPDVCYPRRFLVLVLCHERATSAAYKGESVSPMN